MTYIKSAKIVYIISYIDILWGIIISNEPKYKQLNLKLTEKQLDDLEKLSSAMGNVSKSNLIRIAITDYLIKYKDVLEGD